MPVVPSCILDPLRAQFLALLPRRVVVHPLGCHRRRIDDSIVFDKLIEVLVFGAGYERIGDATCSATTLRRRRDEWIGLRVMKQIRPLWVTTAGCHRLHAGLIVRCPEGPRSSGTHLSMLVYARSGPCRRLRTSRRRATWLADQR